MMDALRRLCCCGDTNSEDLVPYERLEEDSPNAGRNRQNNGVQNNGLEEADGARGIAGRGPPKTSEEEEEDALNKILEATQNNIIDVTHLEGNSLNTTDYIQRARQYEEAITAHDSKFPKGQGVVPKSPGKPARRLLEDTGNRSADWLGRTALNPQTKQHFIDSLEQIHTAVTAIQVTHKQDLVVHMDF